MALVAIPENLPWRVNQELIRVRCQRCTHVIAVRPDNTLELLNHASKGKADRVAKALLGHATTCEIADFAWRWALRLDAQLSGPLHSEEQAAVALLTLSRRVLPRSMRDAIERRTVNYQRLYRTTRFPPRSVTFSTLITQLFWVATIGPITIRTDHWAWTRTILSEAWTLKLIPPDVIDHLRTRDPDRFKSIGWV